MNRKPTTCSEDRYEPAGGPTEATDTVEAGPRKDAKWRREGTRPGSKLDSTAEKGKKTQGRSRIRETHSTQCRKASGKFEIRVVDGNSKQRRRSAARALRVTLEEGNRGIEERRGGGGGGERVRAWSRGGGRGEPELEMELERERGVEMASVRREEGEDRISAIEMVRGSGSLTKLRRRRRRCCC
ncbi:hypothetical protein MPTK1_6g10220 [Marchantia polymorpha subsp. ruderalis]|uniref:Uncharacterized protein n=2 Tax=Marchantia polymorpha TaxID=3197 RepID=A0AAF6BQI3_MARPO|nr:hypothetical protein MARPO_0016s0065 [Marchantia polymorpha]BBN14267.1 hypothetical protein Mp_6g10220 [Marchantia polymorpha subsp. ruderalis]|eukprot:PTQ45002.1 hypothetical protein MARPO_0016s0065 [Marchantia polymorpha]